MEKLRRLEQKARERSGPWRDIPDDALITFTLHTFPQYVADPVHYLIAKHLAAVVRGETRRLMIFAPPQHGKSELVSVRLPAFWFGERPNDSIILASYGASLAEDKGRQARDVVESEAYRAMYPNIRVNQASRSAQQWRLLRPYRGFMFSSGIGGPVTGHGATLGIIDDPFASWEQAQSATFRQRAWDWYTKTFRTRIQEGGAIIVIMTRWHEDDLAGRILNDSGADWTVLRLPAEPETQEQRDENNRRLGLPAGQPDPLGRGLYEPLAPHRFSWEALMELKRNVGSVGWSAEYQGVPVPPEGQRIKREWLSHLVDRCPTGATVRRIRYWDKGGTDAGGAYTAGVRVSVDSKTGLVYIEDVVRGQWSYGTREDMIERTAIADAQEFGRTGVTIYVEQEPGSGGKESAQATIKRLAGFVVKRDLPTGNKDARLEPFAAQAEAGNVRLVRGPWNMAYVDELSAVPNAARRDQADATAGAFNLLTGARTLLKKAPVVGLYSSVDRAASLPGNGEGNGRKGTGQPSRKVSGVTIQRSGRSNGGRGKKRPRDGAL